VLIKTFWFDVRCPQQAIER